MIRAHEFNSRWWGSPVGIVDDGALFDLPTQERMAQLQAFAWVEFRAVDPAPALQRKLAGAGFVRADAQVRFRIRLSDAPLDASAAALVTRFADEQPFVLEPDLMQPFEHERFALLAGADARRLAQRYAAWGSDLVRDQPARCLQVLSEGRCQGWFLSRSTGQGLNLALAALHREATVSGLHLYASALRAYALRGERLGSASFSVSNAAVLNIYARLGARFLNPELVWLWERTAAAP